MHSYFASIHNMQNLKKSYDEESQNVSNNIDEITQIYKEKGIPFSPAIQKQIENSLHAFEKTIPDSTEDIQFTPFDSNAVRDGDDNFTGDRTKSAKYILSHQFNISEAIKSNRVKFEKIAKGGPILDHLSNYNIKGVYIPRLEGVDLTDVILQAFIRNESQNDKEESNNEIDGVILSNKKKISQNKKNRNEIASNIHENLNEPINEYHENNNVTENKIENEANDEDDIRLIEKISNDYNSLSDVPFIVKDSPDLFYMAMSFKEKIEFELESLGFDISSDQDLIMKNYYYSAYNHADIKKVDHEIERANLAKNLLNDIIIEHSHKIEEHNRNLGLIEYFNQYTYVGRKGINESNGNLTEEYDEDNEDKDF
ncbi:hypothetical protein M9Y10_027328 [Tritrichomonas musculus]|uniref:Uncharacterized protein n=1 Tax=Tritrichomonas musculus TaxID=1915356 RepID=A0ABR2H5K4_9EUKA